MPISICVPTLHRSVIDPPSTVIVAKNLFQMFFFGKFRRLQNPTSVYTAVYTAIGVFGLSLQCITVMTNRRYMRVNITGHDGTNVG